MKSNHSRRNFLQQITIATASLLFKDSLLASTVSASTTEDVAEKYLVSVPFLTAREGGTQDIILYSGTSYSFKVPYRTKNNTIIKRDGIELDIRTLYDTNSRIAATI